MTVAMVLLLGKLGFIVLREPHFEGEPLSYWIRPYSSDWIGIGWDRLDRESTEVLRKHHEIVLPHLLRLLRRPGDIPEGKEFERQRDALRAPTPAEIIRLFPWEGRYRAAGAIGRLGELAESAAPELEAVFLNGSDYASPAAAKALARIVPVGTESLLSCLRSGTVDQKCLACWGLIDSPELTPEIRQALRDCARGDHVELIRSAAQTLRVRKIPDQEFIGLTIEALNRKQPSEDDRGAIAELCHLLILLPDQDVMRAQIRRCNPERESAVREFLSRYYPDAITSQR